MSRITRKLSQMMARGLKFPIQEVEELYYVAKTKALISGYLAADLRLYFRNMQEASFLMIQLICDPVPFNDIHYLSRIVRKPDFRICENKDADQLCGNREADQRLCFPYIDSTIPLLPTYEISSL